LWDMRVGGNGSGLSGGGAATAASNHVLVTADQTTWRPSHRAWITSVRWSEETPYRVASASHDGTVKLWDLRASLPVQTLSVAERKAEDDDKVLCVALGRRDKRIYAGGTGCVLRQYTATSRW
jgi:ribosome biogenesis protein YTM1